ncbi:hypothetical protein [Kibdelosporangium aridum]|uniref:Uncharacterized protein n=1 Tax=Kibdelosporangium aridum TaxID=2030 RepID=A0A1Y5XJK9_KIBAR|nr:hypothetical protein [Kibdelosporangium aridum]SMC99117.1 hypothetical protein SAMN05661093_03640 [Kibdelosporangium aridum]
MYADDDVLLDEYNADFLADVDFGQDTALTPLDPEFHHLVSNPRLSAELAQLREPGPEPTTALLDGSARARRDRRIAERALEHGGAPAGQARGSGERRDAPVTTEAA